ncbi:MAG TPA: hypothetical protein DCZ08_03585 [Anaerolineaceae bacterium]|nr:hypothetical protein [Anaerolineaceae bacterium]
MNEEEKRLLEIEEEIRTGIDPRAAVIGYIDECYEKNTAEEKYEQDPTASAYFIPNRHDRRRAAAKARQARREKLKKHGHA